LGDIERQRFSVGNQLTDVTLVASGCNDNTVLTVEKFSKTDPRIHLIVEGRRNGKPSAINKILETMAGETLVLLSGDIRLPSTRFVDGLASYCNDGVGVVASRPLPINDVNTKAGYMGHLMWKLHDRTLMVQVENGLPMQAGEAFAIRREAAGHVPLDVINDDAYLVLRAQMMGHKYAYARAVTVLNRTPERLHDILVQRARIIKGHHQLKKMIGITPNVLDTLIFKRPLVAVSVVVQEIESQLKARELRSAWLFELVVLELVAHLLSRSHDFASVWPVSKSAKWSKYESQRASEMLA
jgi:glycosyltransferase involved in cell wall biosynthesis